ncbi:LytR C-terminal domain-containing protein [Leifsonia sp. ZF2019]|uniref:LytR C-terminal domain-containing protein n=1 Tax=Leifsonia sp. ZF2019 TaxID=2781978 RepID=UPI001CC1148A|nr:LytR C-terminal domain-containing protein [Leifsonia sp. ZF2019]UAJ78543.1 LytR C-terminal domain-containing protein [Leifsonia sp. ZF2019]
MADKHPRDRFDEIPDDIQRVGAHRAPRPRGRGWIAFGWAALATVVLVGAGIFGLSLVNGAISFNGSTPSGSATASATETSAPTQTVVPTVDPSLSVNVLNGTATSGLGAKVRDVLTAAGWKVGAVANADMTNLTQTVVYYADPTKEGAALGVAQSLPGATVQNTQDFADTGADLTVVVGSDYAG